MVLLNVSSLSPQHMLAQLSLSVSDTLVAARASAQSLSHIISSVGTIATDEWQSLGKTVMSKRDAALHEWETLSDQLGFYSWPERPPPLPMLPPLSPSPPMPPPLAPTVSFVFGEPILETPGWHTAIDRGVTVLGQYPWRQANTNMHGMANRRTGPSGPQVSA